MTLYQYKVLPAPTRGKRQRGVKGPEARFSRSIEDTLNGLAADGWEYVRSDILPSEERQGLKASRTVYRSLLVFRRLVTEDLPEETYKAPEDVDDQNSDIEEDLGLSDESPEGSIEEDITAEDQEDK